MTLDEKCHCGAALHLTSTASTSIEYEAQRWRAEHRHEVSAAPARSPDWPAADCCLDTCRCYCGQSTDPDRLPRPTKLTAYEADPADVERLAGVLAMIQHHGNEANARADLANWRGMAEGLLMSSWLDDMLRRPS